MNEFHDLTTPELIARRKGLLRQIAELQKTVNRINAVVGYRDAILMERQAETGYQKARKPNDPPTLAAYWALRDAETTEQKLARINQTQP